MTANEMIPAVGAKVLVYCESLGIECRVKDVKMSWGKPRFLVTPIAGNGEQWVEMGRIRTPALPENRLTWSEVQA